MRARCDECGAVMAPGDARCPRCGEASAVDLSPAVIHEPTARAGWRALRVGTYGYALAQLALVTLSSAFPARDAPHLGTRLALLAAFVAAPLWMARRRARAWLTPWAALLCAGTLVALAFLLTGLTPRGALPALTLAVSAAWSAATAYAAWLVRRSEGPGR